MLMVEVDRRRRGLGVKCQCQHTYRHHMCDQRQSDKVYGNLCFAIMRSILLISGSS